MNNGRRGVYNNLHFTALYMLLQIVCPSVCQSHSGIVSERGNAEGCGLHQCLWLMGTTLFT